MMIDMDEFFPCYKNWLAKLLSTVISRSDDPGGYTATIRLYLEMRMELTQRWILEHSVDGKRPKKGYITDFKKMKSNEKKIRDCLDLIGGADEHSNRSAG